MSTEDEPMQFSGSTSSARRVFVRVGVERFARLIRLLDVRWEDAEQRRLLELDRRASLAVLEIYPHDTYEMQELLAWVVAVGSFLWPGQIVFDSVRYAHGAPIDCIDSIAADE